MFDYFSDSLNKKLIFKYVDLEDLIEARKVIEVKNANLAAQKATKEDIDILQKNLSDMKRCIAKNNISKYIATNIKFHEIIAEIAQNHVLYEIFIAIKRLLKESQEMIIKYPGIMVHSLEYHEKIYRAIEEGKACVAEEAMLAHLDDVNKALVSVEII